MYFCFIVFNCRVKMLPNFNQLRHELENEDKMQENAQGDQQANYAEQNF